MIIPQDIDVETDDAVDDDIIIVMEFIDSDLRKILDDRDRLSFKEEHVIIIMYNFLCSLNYLHSAGIMHRDIKPANILLDYNSCTKLCDFGLARCTPVNNNHKEMLMYLSLIQN